MLQLTVRTRLEVSIHDRNTASSENHGLLEVAHLDAVIESVLVAEPSARWTTKDHTNLGIKSVSNQEDHVAIVDCSTDRNVSPIDITSQLGQCAAKSSETLISHDQATIAMTGPYIYLDAATQAKDGTANAECSSASSVSTLQNEHTTELAGNCRSFLAANVDTITDCEFSRVIGTAASAEHHAKDEMSEKLPSPISSSGAEQEKLPSSGLCTLAHSTEVPASSKLEQLHNVPQNESDDSAVSADDATHFNVTRNAQVGDHEPATLVEHSSKALVRRPKSPISALISEGFTEAWAIHALQSSHWEVDMVKLHKYFDTAAH